MANLTARSPAHGLVPSSFGACTLSEDAPRPITSMMILSGGTGLPEPGRSRSDDGRLVLWSGMRQALALGPPPDPTAGIAQTDQSDAWCVLMLEGADAAAVLARLTPLDLNTAIFPPGGTARSLLGHMNALIHREADDIFRLMVFRSMAASAVHEIQDAMRSVAARHVATARFQG